MIPDDVVERVREQADIVAIVGELVKLKRVGNSFRGPCPFHQGKDPNFSVSPRGGYVCFVCHEKGDVFTFVQKRLGLDFVDAVRYVGGKSGVEVKEVTRQQQTGPDPRERFWEVNAAAADYFASQLWGQDGGPARDYLANRNMDRATAERFAMGYAPRDGAGLRSQLNTLGFEEAVQVQAGLLHVKEEGQEPRPRFRNRLMFPIYDPQNRVIAFGGRVIGAGEPKYLNSAESLVFVKGNTLYGLNWAKNAIRKDEHVLLVEGYFDCVRLMAAGIESVVAPLGTALTEPQAELIRKYTNTVFLLYDSDKAGLKATFRAGDVLLRQGCKVHVVTLPDGEDPDTFVAQHGGKRLEAELGNAIDVFERKVQLLQRGGWFTDIRRKRAALDRLLPSIRAASDPIAFGLYIARAAEVAGINEDVLRRELNEPSSKRAIQRPPKDDPRPRPPAPERSEEAYGAEQWLVHVLLSHRHLIAAGLEQVDKGHFRDARLRAIFTELMRASDQELARIDERLPDHALEIYRKLESQPPMPNAQIVFDSSVAQLKIRRIVEQLDDIERDMPLAADVEKNELLSQQAKLFTDLRGLGGQRWKSVRNKRNLKGTRRES